jgi:phage-related tail protein
MAISESTKKRIIVNAAYFGATGLLSAAIGWGAAKLTIAAQQRREAEAERAIRDEQWMANEMMFWNDPYKWFNDIYEQSERNRDKALKNNKA